MSTTRPLRDRLEEIPAGTDLLRGVRHLVDEELGTLDLGELERAERWLQAASYSALEGARRIRRYIDHHHRSTPRHADPPQ